MDQEQPAVHVYRPRAGDYETSAEYVLATYRHYRNAFEKRPNPRPVPLEYLSVLSEGLMVHYANSLKDPTWEKASDFAQHLTILMCAIHDVEEKAILDSYLGDE